jgi:hypothetical protein
MRKSLADSSTRAERHAGQEDLPGTGSEGPEAEGLQLDKLRDSEGPMLRLRD